MPLLNSANAAASQTETLAPLARPTSEHAHDLQRTEATEAKITAASAAADAKIAGKRDLLYSKETYYI